MPRQEIRKYSRKPNRSRGKTKLLESTENLNTSSTKSNAKSLSPAHPKNNQNTNMSTKTRKGSKEVPAGRAKHTIENAFRSQQSTNEFKPFNYKTIFPPPLSANSPEPIQRAYKEMRRVEGLTDVSSKEKLTMWSLRELQQLKKELASLKSRHIQHITVLQQHMRQFEQQKGKSQVKVKREPSSPAPASPRQKDSKLEDYFPKQISNQTVKAEPSITGTKRKRAEPSTLPPAKRRRTDMTEASGGEDYTAPHETGGALSKRKSVKISRGRRKNVVDDDDEYDPTANGDTEADEDFVADVVEDLTDLSETETKQGVKAEEPQSLGKEVKSEHITGKTKNHVRARRKSKLAETPVTPSTPKRRRTRRKDFYTIADEKLFPEEIDTEEEKAKKGETAVQRFWNYLELFFEPITPKLLERLNPKEPNEDDPSFQIPPLGRHYKEAWVTEDSFAFNDDSTSPDLHEESVSGIEDQENGSSFGESLKRMCEEQTTLMNDTIEVKQAADAYSDHSLSQRILSALVEESPSIPQPSVEAKNQLHYDNLQRTLSSTSDYEEMEMLSLEERLVKELKDIGVLTEEDTVSSIDNREDDPLCVEIRSLQDKLREMVQDNNKLKLAIKQHVEKEAVNESCIFAEFEKDKQNLAKYEQLMQEKKQKGKKGRKSTKRRKQ